MGQIIPPSTQKTAIRCSMASATGLASGATIPFATEIKDVNSEWDATTFTFTSKAVQDVRVHGVFYTTALETAKFANMIINKDAAPYTQSLYYNANAASKDLTFPIDAIVPCVVGTTITLSVEHNNASTVLGASTNATRTFLEIYAV
jgi:hypothetical protein